MKTFIVFLVLSVVQLQAQTAPSQYRYLRIGVDQGLSDPAGTGVLRDSYGYLWIVTFDGLNRWDGYTMKVYRHDSRDSNSIPSTIIYHIQEERSRDILIMGYDGIASRYNRASDNFSIITSTPNGRSTSNHISADSNGGYWITSSSGIKNINFTTNRVVQFDYRDSTKHGYSMSEVQSLITVHDGNAYAFGIPGYCKYDGSGRFEHVFLCNSTRDSLEYFQKNKIFAVSVAPDGMFWLATAFGLCQLDPTTKRTEWYKVPIRLAEKFKKAARYEQDLRSVCVDKNGVVWIGSWQGLFRFDPITKQFTEFTSNLSSQSISSNNIYDVFVDSQGIVWGGTWGRGVFGVVPGNTFTSYRQSADAKSGPNGNYIFTFWEDRDSNVYIGAYDRGVSYFNRKTSTFSHLHFPTESVWRIDTARNGDLLFLSDQRGVYKRTKQSFVLLPAPQKQEEPAVTMANAVLGTYSYSIKNGTAQGFQIAEKFETVIGEYKLIGYENLYGWLFSKKSGIVRYNLVSDTYQTYNYVDKDSSDLSSSGRLIVGKEPNILWWICGLDSIKIVRFNKATGAYTLQTTTINRRQLAVRNAIFDRQDNLWISTSSGLFRLNIHSGVCKVFTKDDGLPSSFFNHNDAAYLGKSGRLYFGTPEGYVEFYPENVQENTFKPPVVFTAFRRDDKDIPLDSSIAVKQQLYLAYDQNRFSVEFSALNFISPQKNSYKYRLEGYEAEWIVSGSRREAFYTNLAPGTYTFCVLGSNNDGVWNEREARLRITITPPWWQTVWAYLSYSCLFIAGFVVIRRTDLKRQQQKLIEEQRERENAIIKEKNALLEIEQAKSESLLLNVLPASIAERLKSGERNIADHYGSVTILFADIVGFTPLTTRKQPREIVELLNNLFTRFDRVTEQYGAERIKTIGDAYMAVAGAPTPCEDHASRIAKLAFAMMEQTELFCADTGENIQLRIGINSGEAIGAVIGEKKFIYDVWSDAVNTASRMESHSLPGKIHCTREFTSSLGQTEFHFTDRGEIDIKGKGMMRTYFLEKR